MEFRTLIVLVGMIQILLIPNVGAQLENLSTNTVSNDTTVDETDLEEQYFSQGNDLFHEGKYSDAISYFDKALAINPNDTDVLYQKGRALNNLNKYDDAISNYNKVLSIDPNYTEVFKSMGISLDNLGKNEQAIEYYDKVLTIEPNDSDTMYHEGLALQKMGKNDEAMNYYNKTLNTDPANTGAMYQMGQILEKIGKKDEAISYYDKILAINPQDTRASNSKDLILGQSTENQTDSSHNDQTIMAVIGVAIASAFGITMIKKMKIRNQQSSTIKTMDSQETYKKNVISETQDDDYKWKGI